MASILRPTFPESLQAALDMRAFAGSCPPAVMTMFSSIPFFRSKASARPAPPSSRFAISGTPSGGDGFGKSGGWRGGGGSSAHAGGDGDGFQVWKTKRRTPQNRILPYASSYTPTAPLSSSEAAPAKAVPSAGTAPPADVAVSQSSSTPEPVKFSSAAIKSGVDMEDRLLARVKGKINKIGYSTYDATKGFMQQILDSEETDFLDDLMAFVFQKAATESTFCPLYARLLHELADEFKHLRVVMKKLFTDYTIIFTEMDTVPDVGTADYKAFLDAQERKKFRRGYSQFVAELVKYGEADKDAFAALIRQIVTVLEESAKIPERTLMCEEYIDCLANMCSSASAILSSAPWADDVHKRIDAIIKLPRSDSPGLTNKGRFALMDISDKAKRGWK